MEKIKSGTKWLLFFSMVAALAALASCASERHAAMSASPGPALTNPSGIGQRPIAPPGVKVEDAAAPAAPTAQAQHSQAIRTPDDKNAAPRIGWVPWSDAAFAKARAENKLVFLEISSEWSAWPREPGGGFPSDPEMAAIIEKNYIPVYVDADKRPDVYEQYGRGGLPSLSILNPDGYILASANAMTAPELKNLLAMLAKNYEKNKSLIDEALKSSSSVTSIAKQKPSTEAYPLEKIPSGTLAALAAEWDPVYGGIGRKKFPMPEALDFLLYASIHPKFHDGVDPKPLAKAALDGMAAGLFDRTEGGFFRYSDTPDWKSPHKEKLLGLNSELIITYLTAYEAYGDKEYLRIAESSARFLCKYLLDKNTGAFVNSRTEAKTPGAATFADGNGKAALAFLEAYRVTGKREYLATALNSLDYVIDNLYNEKAGGVRHFAGTAGGMLALSDQVLPGLAAARAYQATADSKYLDFAVKAGSVCEKKLYDPKGFGFYGFWYVKTPPGLLKNIKKPQAENAKMSELLLTLHYLTGRSAYREMARKTVVPFIPAYRKYPGWSAPVATAAAKLFSSTCQFFVVGRKSEPGFGELLDESYRFEDPDRVVVPLDEDRDKGRIKGLGYGHENTPMLYVCSDKACFSPLKPGESMESVRALLKKCRDAERQEKYGR